MSWCCLPCFGSSAKDADSKDSLKKEVSAKDGSVTQQSHRASLDKSKSRGGSEHKELTAPKEGPTANIAAQTFTFRELAAATKNFRPECLLGEGGFGRVYKGRLESTGQIVAVKQLDRNGLQGNREFLVEVLMLSLLHHTNLVNLIGYCADGDQRLLVYEYMALGSLEDHLHDLPPGKEPLDWNTRMTIAAGAAKGLEYLHDKANPPVIYRDLKSSNILLGDGYHPKLSDFGLAKLGPVGDKTHVSTRVMGTYGYCAPEYAMTGQLTLKSDVYSFGVVFLELITGRKAIDNARAPGEHNLVAWARPLFKDRRKFPKMADPSLQGRYPMRGLYQALAVAAMCLQEQAATSKPPLLSGVPNRKRMTSNRSSSPPVTQWAGKRPKKISRVARRTSLVPFVSSNDDIPSSDNMSDVGCSETSFGFPRRSPAASPRMRLKGENSLSTTALSGSEEFSPPEIKSKDKGKQSDEVDGKAALNVRKLSITGLQSRKNKLVFSGEELRDGVRRQGRTGRGFGSTRSVNPMGVMRHGTTKQLRSARNSSDKNESRVGRPPTRKLSDPKAYKRQRNTSANATTLDFLDDGHEELLAAVNSAINFAQNFSSPFWKQMERYFCFISDAHINFVKQLGGISPMSTTPVGTSSDFDGREKFSEGLTTSRVDSKASPLYQRLLSALISEDSASVNEDLQFDGFGADAESEFSALNHMEFNGYRSDKLEFDELEDDVSVIPLKGVNSSAHIVSGRFTDHLYADFSDIQYETLGIDEKIYLEAQSIGICLEPMANISNVEDEGIVDEIKTLEEAVYEVGSKKKEMLNRLLTPALEMKELQEKEFDRLGYEKLIEMAYEKSKASRRHHSASGKSSANKVSKQAAFAFMKRTLGRCRQFEETGKSCFSESTFKNILVAGLTQIEDNPTDKEDILSASTPMGSQPSSSLALRIKQNTENYTDSSEHTLREGKDETMWLNRTKERELLLDDVCGTPLSSSTKGKRSDRDRDGKGQASSSRGRGTKKMGRPALSNNAKGERKSKTKPRLKTTPMFSSPSVSILEQNRTSSSKPTDTNNSEYSNLETLDETEPLDLSGLQIPDGLGGPDDFDAQAGDLSSWLNIDDNALQDNDIDLLGLQIPMDDLSDLKMMV